MSFGFGIGLGLGLSRGVAASASVTISGLTSGRAQIGTTVSVQVDGGAPTGTIQWLANGTPIPGATSATYTVEATYNGQILTVDHDGEVSGGRAISYAAPQLTAAPSIAGTTGLGDTLTATAGTWTGDDVAISGEWLRDGTGTGITALTYTIAIADSGADLTYRETASNSGGAPFSVSNTITIQTFAAPVISGLPTISGSPEIGQTLTLTPASTTGNPTPSASYQWRRNGAAIPGASGLAYTLVAADQTATITATQSATNAIGSNDATSAATAAVLYPAPTAANGLADQTFNENSGTQTYDTSGDFTFAGARLYSLTSAPAGVTIDQAGLVSFPTNSLDPQSGTSIVVRVADANAPARFGESGFSLTVEAASGGQDVIPDPIGSDPALVTQEGGGVTEVDGLTATFLLTDDPADLTVTNRTAALVPLTDYTGNEQNASGWGDGSNVGGGGVFISQQAANDEVVLTAFGPGVHVMVWEAREADHATNPPDPRRWSSGAVASAQVLLDVAPLAMGAPSLAATETTITVTFGADPAPGVAPITRYDVRYRTSPSGSWIEDQNVSTGYVISGLTEATGYDVQTRAANDPAGPGAWSPSATITTQAGAGDTTPPTVASISLAGQAITMSVDEASGQATVNWALVATGSTPTEAQVVAGTGGGILEAGSFSVTAGGDTDVISISGTVGDELHLVLTDASGNSTGTPSVAGNTIITGLDLSSPAEWQITDNTDGTFTIASAPVAPGQVAVTDNTDGTFDVEAA